MEESATLDSESKGNWVKENVLTKSLFEKENLLIYKNVIQNYSRKMLDHHKETMELDDVGSTPQLEFPQLKYSYDIYNARKYYKQVQNWQGVVTEIDDNCFKAKLYDLSSGGTNEIAEFDLEEVSPSDKHLLNIGSLFYWSVGRYMEDGQMINRSDIRFQRLITLDENDIDNIKRNIEAKYSNLKERLIVRTGTE